jgi:hypothetical protein
MSIVLTDSRGKAENWKEKVHILTIHEAHAKL